MWHHTEVTQRDVGSQCTADTQLGFHNTMAASALLNGSEAYILKETDRTQIQSAEMRFLWVISGCRQADCFWNEQIREEFGIFAIHGKIRNYKQCWQGYVDRREWVWLSKIMIGYNPIGKRHVGCQLEEVELVSTSAYPVTHNNHDTNNYTTISKLIFQNTLCQIS